MADDFAGPQGTPELPDGVATSPELSDLGALAHRIAESPEGELIDDEASVRHLLRLEKFSSTGESP